MLRLLAIVANNRVEILLLSWVALFTLGWVTQFIIGRIKFRTAIKHHMDEHTKAALTEMQTRTRKCVRAAKRNADLAGRQAVAIRGALDVLAGLDIAPDISDNN